MVYSFTLLLLLTLLLLSTSTGSNAAAAMPNIIFVLTDDQDLLHNSMKAMPFTVQTLGAGGATFDRFHAHTPVCCPSRAELLSGRYFHNIKNARPEDDSDPGTLSCMHVNTDDNFQNRMVFVRALSEVGYATGYFGKYLNEHGMEHLCPLTADTPAPLAPPLGWSTEADAWLVMCPDTCYYDCAFGTTTGLRTFGGPWLRARRGAAAGLLVLATPWLLFCAGVLALHRRLPDRAEAKAAALYLLLFVLVGGGVGGGIGALLTFATKLGRFLGYILPGGFAATSSIASRSSATATVSTGAGARGAAGAGAAGAASSTARSAGDFVAAACSFVAFAAIPLIAATRGSLAKSANNQVGQSLADVNLKTYVCYTALPCVVVAAFFSMLGGARQQQQQQQQQQSPPNPHRSDRGPNHDSSNNGYYQEDGSYDLDATNYATSVIGNATLAFMARRLAAGVPFFALVATHAPHGYPKPAPWYAATTFPGVAGVPRTPSFGVAVKDHYWMVAHQPPVSRRNEAFYDAFFVDKLRTLLSVDDIMREAHGLVESYGALDNTYFLFTSDHGFHLGQRNLGACKRTPYDLDLRVPFLASGPGIRPGTRVSAMASLVDVAATVLDLAGTEASDHGLSFDGKSLKRFLHAASPPMASSPAVSSTSALLPAISEAVSETPWRDAVLVEYAATTLPGVVNTEKDGDPRRPHPKDVSNNTFAGLRIFTGGGHRHAADRRAGPAANNDAGDASDAAIANVDGVVGGVRDWAYFEMFDAYGDWAMSGKPQTFLLFDLQQDPDQLHNIYPSTDEATRTELRRRLHEQLTCQGGGCA